jgi:hypothetical protein
MHDGRINFSGDLLFEFRRQPLMEAVFHLLLIVSVQFLILIV